MVYLPTNYAPEILMISIGIAVLMTPLTPTKWHVVNYMILYTKKSSDEYVLLTHLHIILSLINRFNRHDVLLKLTTKSLSVWFSGA